MKEMKGWQIGMCTSVLFRRVICKLFAGGSGAKRPAVYITVSLPAARSFILVLTTFCKWTAGMFHNRPFL